MANRLHDPAAAPLPSALHKARADLSRRSRGGAEAGEHPEPTGTMTAAADPAGFPARLDLMRARLGKAREDAISALLFLGDAQQDCNALLEICQANDWPLTARGIELLSDCLRRAMPSEIRHLDLAGLLIEALYALRRAEAKPEMDQAGMELLQGLTLAIQRELGDGKA